MSNFRQTGFCALLVSLAFTVSAGAATIGLDAVHGPANTEALGTGSWYAEMRSQLESDYTVLVITDFSPGTLASCDAVFVSQARSTDEAFTAEEIASIQGYVSAGGGLAAFAEGGYSTGSTVTNFNELLSPFGVEVSDSATGGNGHVVTEFLPHQVTSGLSSVGVDFQRRLVSILPPAVDLTPGGEADDIIAAVDGLAGAGNVVIMSDPSSFSFPGDDTGIYQQDNLRLLTNIASFVVPEPASLLLLSIGALGLLRRRAD